MSDDDGDFKLDLTDYNEPSEAEKAQADAEAKAERAADFAALELHAEIEEMGEHGPAAVLASLPDAPKEHVYSPPGYGAVAILDESGKWVDAAHLALVEKILARYRAESDAKAQFAVERGGFGVFDPADVMDVDALDDLQNVDYLIGQWLERGAITMLFADSHVGKTFLSLDWSACIATGKDWFGRPVQRGRVLYVLMEGRGTFKKRRRAWEQHYGASLSKKSFSLYAKTVNMLDTASVDALASYAREQKFDLIVIDTLSRSITGADENSTEMMGRFVASVSQIREAHEPSHLLVLHHAKKDNVERYRGASVLYAAFDNVYCLSRVDRSGTTAGQADPRRYLAQQKVRLDQPQPVMNLIFEQVPAADSAVLVEDLRAKMPPIVIHLLDMQKTQGARPITRADLKNSFAAAGLAKNAESANAMITPLIASGALLLDPTTKGLSVGVIGRKP